MINVRKLIDYLIQNGEINEKDEIYFDIKKLIAYLKREVSGEKLGRPVQAVKILEGNGSDKKDSLPNSKPDQQNILVAKDDLKWLIHEAGKVIYDITELPERLKEIKERYEPT